MDARPYNLNNVRRAADERRKAAAALTEEARRMHLDLAEIFEARAGLYPGAVDGSNVMPLRPKAGRARPMRAARAAAAAETSPAGAQKRRARSRSNGRTSPRAG